MSDAPTLFSLAATVTDPDAIASLVTGDDLTRLGLASNGSTSPEVLRILAHDQTPAVRLMALLRDDCPASTRAAAVDELPQLLEQVTPLLEASAPEQLTTFQRAVAAAIARGD